MRIAELLPGGMALAEYEGVRKEVSVALLKNPAVGDYVIVHVGFALARMDLKEARATLDILAELAAPGE
jgi:hydrogenase expression/formation protein HypC